MGIKIKMIEYLYGLEIYNQDKHFISYHIMDFFAY